MGEKRKAGILLNQAALRRRYPASGLASEICFTETKTLKLPCSILMINYHMGGGVGYGKIVELAGEESAGKTGLALNFARACQALGGWVLWDDAESAFDGPWAKKHGLELKRIELLPYENEFEVLSDWIADMCIYYRSKLTHNEPILLVIDSIAILETGDAMEIAEQDAKAEMGKRSFNMGKMLRKRNRIFAQYGICVILVNQIRQKVGAGMYEEKETTPLQQSLKFYASQRIWLFRGKRIKRGGKPKGAWVGNLVYIRTKKNKTSIPRDSIQANFFFRPEEGKFGYDPYFGFDELLKDRKIVTRRRGIHIFKGKQIAASDGKFMDVIRTDQKIRARFIKILGINTISKTRQQLEDIDDNLYPVKLKVKKGDDEEDTDTEGE